MSQAFDGDPILDERSCRVFGAVEEVSGVVKDHHQAGGAVDGMVRVALDVPSLVRPNRTWCHVVRLRRPPARSTNDGNVILLVLNRSPAVPGRRDRFQARTESREMTGSVGGI